LRLIISLVFFFMLPPPLYRVINTRAYFFSVQNLKQWNHSIFFCDLLSLFFFSLAPFFFWQYASSSFCSGYFGDRVLVFAQASLDWDSPILCFPILTGLRWGVARHQWLTPIILVTQEAEIRRMLVQSQSWVNSSWDPISKKTHHKKGLADWLEQ
jgi:hypothetical protein